MRELERRRDEGAHWLEIREERIPAHRRWSVRAAQWRALELAREVFGASVEGELDGPRSRGPFHGFLHLAVPFRDLESHRCLEARFTALAGADELLRRIPLVFVFDPVPVARGAGICNEADERVGPR